tara:strand:- start:144 stop:563 length:420 start_codon:yes stop_codon:yes gene_type:complete
MNKYSDNSLAERATIVPVLRGLFSEVLLIADHTIIEGRRGEARQRQLFRTGESKLDWADSNHNFVAPELSMAVDVGPYFSAPIQIPWNNTRAWDLFAGIVFGVAFAQGITNLRWGGDWNRNRLPGDKSDFRDLPHWELV